MRESEMEDLLWSYPERFIAEPLKQFRRQPQTEIGRPDLINRVAVISRSPCCEGSPAVAV